MSTDRELLELAARAAGYTTNHPWNAERLTLNPPVDALVVHDENGLVHTAWNPFTNYGSALLLAANLKMVVDCKKITVCNPNGQIYMWRDSRMSNAIMICRSIVFAAAEIGKAMS